MKSKLHWPTLISEALIRASGWVTSAIVLLIVIFLFKEGLGLLTDPPVVNGLSLAVHPSNSVRRLSPEQIRAIEKDSVRNWLAVGGTDQVLHMVTLDNLAKYGVRDSVGAEFEHLPAVLERMMARDPGVLLVFPATSLPRSAMLITVERLSVWDFIFGTGWYPAEGLSPEFGALPLILGTFFVTFIAILIALPLALAVAIYLAELADSRTRSWVKPAIELLAGIPSVVYGFFGLVVVVPMIKSAFGLSVGETALAGSVLLAIIALPTIITVSEDAIKSTPPALKEASLALGATHWETITKVIVPYAINGISAATILGVGRAIGETMTVLMVTGNAAVIPNSLLVPVRTLSATIAAELGEAPQGGLHYQALFLVGCVLFLITFAFNLFAQYIASRRKFAND